MHNADTEQGDDMKKFILIVVLILSAVWMLSQRYSIKSSVSIMGEQNVVVVDKKSGQIYRIIGGSEEKK